LRIVAEKVKHLEINVVVGPAMGGIVVAYELGRQLKKRAIFTERENNVMTLRRGFEIHPGERVLITKDVVTTGKSSKETADVLESLGAVVVGIACVVDRSREEIFTPVYSAVRLDVDNYEAESCPLCRQGIPFIKPGSRKF
jgi:orotate phosphoribosyltransferase